MIQEPTRFKKQIAVELRKRGSSYSEIENAISIPKSTLAFWLKDIILTEAQKKKLEEKRSKIARANSKKRVLKTNQKIEEIKISSAKNIKEISKRELWLMGIILYWREGASSGNESDLRKGVRFTSSSPYHIKLFLRWLRDVGGIEDNEIGFDVFLSKNKNQSKKDMGGLLNKVINYWSGITSFSKGYFSHAYFKKSGDNRKKIRQRILKSNFGFIRIRVKASSMLARQIAGWTEGIGEILFKEKLTNQYKH